MINDCTSLFLEQIPAERNVKQVYCYYVMKKGKRPEGVDASSKWHTNISLAKDLLGMKL